MPAVKKRLSYLIKVSVFEKPTENMSIRIMKRNVNIFTNEHDVSRQHWRHQFSPIRLMSSLFRN